MISWLLRMVHFKAYFYPESEHHVNIPIDDGLAQLKTLYCAVAGWINECRFRMLDMYNERYLMRSKLYYVYYGFQPYTYILRLVAVLYNLAMQNDWLAVENANFKCIRFQAEHTIILHVKISEYENYNS